MIETRSIKPRPYQTDAVNNVLSAYDEGYSGALVRLPTGCGKTITAGLVAQAWLDKGDNFRVMILCHETQLVHQFKREMHDVLGIEIAVEQGFSKVGVRDKPRVVVASRASLAEKIIMGEGGEKTHISRLKKFDPTDNWLLIVDEAHRYSRRLKLCGHVFAHFEHNPSSRRLGITATPWRTDKVSLESLFPYIACDYQLLDIAGGPCAVLDGWCVPYVNHYVTVEGVDFGKDFRQTVGDFDEEQMAEVLAETKVLASLIEPTLELVGDRRTLIFNSTIEMSKKVESYINAKKGYKACVQLDGSCQPEKREKVYKSHQAGEFQFLSICSLCREGYDDPGIQAVAVFRPTKSTSLAEQMKGRGCRPLRGTVDGLATKEERLQAIDSSPKKDCLVIDLVGITGLAGAASAARCYASGEPDDIVARAEAIMVKGETDVRKAIDRAKEQAEVEAREVAKKKAEDERAALAAKQAMLDARAKYQTSAGAPGMYSAALRQEEQATTKQIGYLRWIRLSFNERIMTKNFASKLITMHRQFGNAVQKLQKEVDKWELARISKL